MNLRHPLHSKEEIARRGSEIYELKVRHKVETGNKGKIVAIDIETEEFEIAEDILPASDRLLTRHPNAQIWFVSIGHKGVHRFGPRLASEKS